MFDDAHPRSRPRRSITPAAAAALPPVPLPLRRSLRPALCIPRCLFFINASRSIRRALFSRVAPAVCNACTRFGWRRPPARPPARGNIVSRRTVVRCTYVSSIYAGFDFLSLSAARSPAERGGAGRDESGRRGRHDLNFIRPRSCASFETNRPAIGAR